MVHDPLITYLFPMHFSFSGDLEPDIFSIQNEQYSERLAQWWEYEVYHLHVGSILRLDNYQW